VDVTVTTAEGTIKLPSAYEYIPDFPEIDLGMLGSHGFILESDPAWLMGESVALGDLTGDGIDDLVVGLRRLGDLSSLKVLITPGSPLLPESLSALFPSSGQSVVENLVGMSYFPVGVYVLGDLNGDRLGDLGIGMDQGGGYILFGRQEFPETVDIEREVKERRAARLQRLAEGADPVSLGLSMAPLGGVEGDGLSRFAVGVSETDLTGAIPNAGEIHFLRATDSWPESVDLSSADLVNSRVHGVDGGCGRGFRVLAGGDVNGDGVADLLASCGEVIDINNRVFLLHGSPEPPGEVDVLTYIETVGGSVLELPDRATERSPDEVIHVAAAGDVNRDGFADILVGDVLGGSLQHGVTFLVFGARDLPRLLSLPRIADPPDGVVRIFGESSYTQAASVGPAGDFNADGFSDFLIAAHDPLITPPGVFFLIVGKPELPPRIDLARLGGQGIRIRGRHPMTQPQVPVQRAGDLNGDGALDVVFSEASRIPRSGAIYVVYGQMASFRRGDANRDGNVDVADAVFLLGRLFLGNQAPMCEDGADANDDGRLELTDAVVLLQHLFLAGPALPPPYPEPGNDPSKDRLGCSAF
ncbi:MAG: dockerin type I domain-containing protein, partial [Thermoanaerobaculia bacterium]